MQLNPYLNFNGNCREAFETYARIFNGRVLMMMTHADIPDGERAPHGPSDRIMHARLRIGDSLLMASDMPADRPAQPDGFCVQVGVETPDEVERIARDLGRGGTVVMAPQETFWAHRFAIVTDRFGTPWMLNCEKPPS